MRLFPRAGNYMVSLKDQLWIHDYDWESCNDRKCDKDQDSDDDQKPHNSGCCKNESEKTIELSLFPAPVVFGQGGGGWWTTMCIKLCGSWMEIEFQDIIHFFVIFFKMYLVK